MNIISIKEISILSVSVTEEIEYKSLHLFLQSSIKNSNFEVFQNTYYTFTYNKKSSSYEIIFYNKNSNDISLEPFLLFERYKKKDSITRLLVCKDYFVVIYKNRVLHLKKINKSKIEEIQVYVNQMYKISEFEVIEVSQDILDSLYTDNNIVSNIFFYPLYPRYSFVTFLIFTICTFIILILTLYFMDTNKITERENSVPLVQEETLSSQIVNKSTEFFNQLKIDNIYIEHIGYKNNRAKIVLYHHSDKKLLDFSKKYVDVMKIKIIKYNEIKKQYIMEVVLEY